MLLSASSEQVTRGKRSRCWEAMLHARAGRLHSRKDESRDDAPAGGETWERVVAIDKEIQALRDLKRKLQGADGSWPLPSSLALLFLKLPVSLTSLALSRWFRRLLLPLTLSNQS